MDEMEEKLGAILNNPQMMQQIMQLAQSMNPSKAVDAQDTPKRNGQNQNSLSKIMGMVSQGNLDSEQQALLKAMSPYLSREKLGKLERAMRAARLAGVASAFMNNGGLQMLAGR